MIQICITSRTLNMGIMVMFLIMGYAGFISPTESSELHPNLDTNLTSPRT